MSTREQYITNLLIDLKALSKVGPGYKLNTKGPYLALDHTTTLQWAKRWYRGDSRFATIERINQLVKSLLQIVDECQVEYYKQKSEDEMKKQQQIEIKNKNKNKNSFALAQKHYLHSEPIVFLQKLYKQILQSKIGLQYLRDTYYEDTLMNIQLELHIQTINDIIDSIHEFLQEENSLPIKLEQQNEIAARLKVNSIISKSENEKLLNLNDYYDNDNDNDNDNEGNNDNDTEEGGNEGNEGKDNDIEGKDNENENRSDKTTATTEFYFN